MQFGNGPHWESQVRCLTMMLVSVTKPAGSTSPLALTSGRVRKVLLHSLFYQSTMMVNKAWNGSCLTRCGRKRDYVPCAAALLRLPALLPLCPCAMTITVLLSSCTSHMALPWAF